MPSPIKASRVTRKFSGLTFPRTKYRRALAYLLPDFENRCAYSMMRVADQAEVDHFDPRKKKDKLQVYENLFPSLRHCNLAKRNTWPTDAEAAKGFRFLDCTQEMDYGECIFEDPVSHRLVGTTAAAKWHIHQLDLNASFLVQSRAERSKLAELLRNLPVSVSPPWENFDKLSKCADEVREILRSKIPDIPPPPAN